MTDGKVFHIEAFFYEDQGQLGNIPRVLEVIYSLSNFVSRSLFEENNVE